MRRPIGDITFLTDEQIKIAASNFLVSIGRDGQLPIDVDQICDELQINVIALPLEKVFGVHAYISSDFSHIVVDEQAYKVNERRARFSIAHELGHSVLHGEFYGKQAITDISTYLEFQNNTSVQSFNKMEYQANMFAGALLVPDKELAVHLDQHYPEYLHHDPIDTARLGNMILNGVQEFNVSESCLLTCIKRDYPGFHSNFMGLVQ